MSYCEMHRKRHDQRIYALYHGDENVCDGTISEIAEHEGVKRDSIYYLTTPCYRRRVESLCHGDMAKSNAKILVLIDEEEEE